MERFSRTNLENIRSIVERETGVQLVKRNYNARRNSSFTVRRVLAVAASLVCLITLSAFAYQKFNSIKGDELALKAVYLGDGKFDLVVKNMSDKKIK